MRPPVPQAPRVNDRRVLYPVTKTGILFASNCMHCNTHMKTKFILLAALLLPPALARAQQYTLRASAIAGGGGIDSSGGIYAASGTVGQPDAGGSQAGGTYSVSAGFWAGMNKTHGAPLLGSEKLVGGKVRIFWTMPATGFVLEELSSGNPTWFPSPWTREYTSSYAWITVTPPAGGSAWLYRLRKP